MTWTEKKIGEYQQNLRRLRRQRRRQGLRFATAHPQRDTFCPADYDPDAGELAADRRAAGAEWWGQDD